jgi:hypothetical protein
MEPYWHVINDAGARVLVTENDMPAAVNPTATELLTLQDTLGRAYRARCKAVNAYVSWPVDALADELDNLMHDIAFERYGKWLCPVAGYLD